MCCYSIAKYLFFAFNFIFWLAGCGVLGVGIWLNVDESISNSIEVADISFVYAGAYVLIVAGAMMFLLGFLGCCGAMKESTCLLGTYFGFLFVLLGLEVGIGIWALVTYPDLQSAINESMPSDIDSYNPDDPLIALQQNLHCCGYVDGCMDWNGIPEGSAGCGCVPGDGHNCTQATLLGCQADETDPTTDFIYGIPCNIAIYEFIETNFTIIAAVGLAIGLAEIFGMVIACCLCKSIKEKNMGISA